jgi:hypothetical protein
MGKIFIVLLIIILIFSFSKKKNKKIKIHKNKIGIIRSIPIEQTSSVKEVKIGMVVIYDSLEGFMVVKLINESKTEYTISIGRKGNRQVCKSEIKSLVVENNTFDRNDVMHISYIGLDKSYWKFAIDNNLIDTGDTVEFEIRKCTLSDNTNISEKAILIH